MNKSLLLVTLLASFSPLSANASIISGYDIINAAVSGTGGWSHTYTGTITPTSGNLANYSGGNGTLNDGIIIDPHLNNQLWYGNSNNGNTFITLHLDNTYQINDVSLFGADGTAGNSIPGAITSLDITINSITSNFTTTGFGGSSTHGNPVNDLIDFTGTLFEGVSTDTLILSNFQTNESASNRFNIVEIEVNGNISSVPVPAAVWLFGTGLIGLMGMRKKT